MARRKSVDATQYILLTKAQRVFAFRNLKQLICYLSRRDSKVRQRRKGQRRYVCVADLAAALLRRDPRTHVEGTLGAVTKVSLLERRVESLRLANCDLENEKLEVFDLLTEARTELYFLRKQRKELDELNDQLAHELRHLTSSKSPGTP